MTSGVFMLFQLYRRNKELYAQLKEPDCPFHGFDAIDGSMTYFGGSRCALNEEDHGLCKREIIGNPSNWFGCPLNTRMNRIAIEMGSEDIMVFPRKIYISGVELQEEVSLMDWIKRTIGKI